MTHKQFEFYLEALDEYNLRKKNYDALRQEQDQYGESWKFADDFCNTESARHLAEAKESLRLALENMIKENQ